MERSDAEVVLAARAGEPGAFAVLFERWFDRAYAVARGIVRDDDTAKEVTQDTFLVVWRQLDTLQSPDAFGGWVLRIARNRALNRLEREQRSRPSEVATVTDARDRGAADPLGSHRLLDTEAISEVHDRQELVWAAAAALGERDASVLDLHLRHGLTPAEIAEDLGINPNAAHQLLFKLRARLGDAIGAYLLWRNGRPTCGALAATVTDAPFGAGTVRAVNAHVRSCVTCSDHRARLVSPEALFAATPLVAVPVLVRESVREALVGLGLPLQGGSAAPPAPDTPPTGDGGLSDGTAGRPPSTGRAHGGARPGARAGADTPADAPAVDTAVDTAADTGAGLGTAAGDVGETEGAGDDERVATARRRRPGVLVAVVVAVMLLGAGVASSVARRGGEPATASAIPTTAGTTLVPGTDPPPTSGVAGTIPRSGPGTTAPTPPGTGIGVASAPTPTTGAPRAGATSTTLPGGFSGASATTTGGPAADAGTTVPGMATPGTTSASVPPPASAPPATAPPSTAPPSTAPPATAPPSTVSPPTTVAPTRPTPTAPPAPTRPPTTAPPAPTSTMPPAPPPTIPPTLAPPPPPTSLPPPPTIVRFFLGSLSGPTLICADPAASPRRIGWTTTGATTVELVVGGATTTVAAAGERTTCAADGTALLRATGPGGTVERALVLP